MARRKTQKDYIREWLLDGKSITPDEAKELCGSSRLAAIIHELRWKEAMDIETINCVCKNRIGGISKYAKYRLRKE